MIFETIIEAVPVLKKFTKQKYTGLQILIFIAVCVVVISLYRLHTDNQNTDKNMQNNRDANILQVQSIITDVSVLKSDVGGLKTDVTGLKTDVSSLKNDVNGLKIDMAIVKNDVGEVKGDVKDIKSALDRTAYFNPFKDSTNSLVITEK
jgi:hypothetical protein